MPLTLQEQNQQLRQLLQSAMPAVAAATLQPGGEQYRSTLIAMRDALTKRCEPATRPSWLDGGEEALKMAQEDAALSLQADECIQGCDFPMETEAHQRTRWLWDLKQIVRYLDNDEDRTIASGSVFHLQMRMAYEALSVEPKPLAYIRSRDLDRLAPEQVAGCSASLRKQPGKGWLAIHTIPEAMPDDPETI